MRVLSRSACVFVTSLLVSSLSMATEVQGDSYGIAVYQVPTNAIAMSLFGPNFSENNISGFSYVAEKELVDGVYGYQILGTLVGKNTENASDGSDGRRIGAQAPNVPIGVIEEGKFEIQGGVVLSFDGSAAE